MNRLDIGHRLIGPGQPAFLIAELSGNHLQRYELAEQLVRAAKDVGADAVKLQTYTADTITMRSDRSEFVIQGGTLWDGRNMHDLFGEAMTPWEWQPKLKQLADEIGLELFSSPFDPTAVDFLEAMHVRAHKVASCELIDLPLIEKIARTGKPMLMSTGMATLGEIEEAVAAARGAGATQIALLKCVSAYPAPPETMNLRTIPHMAAAFDLPTGLSDHTLGIAVPVAAVSLGACLVEKHFTLSRSLGGPDAEFSLEPDEFRAMVEAIRVAEKAMGSVHYGITPAEAAERVQRRSLFVVRAVAKGETFTTENVRSIRPGHGLAPKHLPDVLGRRATEDIEPGTPLRWDLVGMKAP